MCQSYKWHKTPCEVLHEGLYYLRHRNSPLKTVRIQVETNDGCWEEHDFDDCDEETQEWLEEFFEENSWLDLEEHGWIQDECEMIIDCDLEICKINEDGSLGDPVEVKSEEETEPESQPEPVKLEPNSVWPFGGSKEEE